MNCLDCTTRDHHGRPAIGTCHHCGAGVCVDHAVLVDDILTRIEPLTRIVPVDPPARQLRCHPCDAALAAAAPTALSWKPVAARPRRTRPTPPGG